MDELPTGLLAATGKPLTRRTLSFLDVPGTVRNQHNDSAGIFESKSPGGGQTLGTGRSSWTVPLLPTACKANLAQLVRMKMLRQVEQ